MIGETFQYVKQVGYVLTVRENIKTGDIFVEERKGEWFCPRAGCLCMRIIRDKLIWIRKVGHLRKELYTFSGLRLDWI